jgi:hypothetical protein
MNIKQNYFTSCGTSIFNFFAEYLLKVRITGTFLLQIQSGGDVKNRSLYLEWSENYWQEQNQWVKTGTLLLLVTGKSDLPSH